MPLRIQGKNWQTLALLSIPLSLIGCSSVPLSEPDAGRKASLPKSASKNIPVLPPAGSGRGKYYLDDGPGDDIPDGLVDMPDPEPRLEPYAERGNKPYVVFGTPYTPFTDDRPHKQRGIGSWYGKKFHGQKTSSGEPYDMYKISAAHPTLPIPSYARVTNLANGKQIVVRVNDRGPFHSGRIIDLSFTAALKLGYLGKGSGQLEVERILPDEIRRMASNKRNGSPADGGTVVVQDTGARMAAGVSVLPVAAVSNGDIVSTPLPATLPQQGEGGARPLGTVALSGGVPGVAAAASGFYVQLGAYSQSANAEAMRARLMRGWSAGMPPVEVVEQGNVYRLHSGPFASRIDAAAAAVRLQETVGARPLIVQR
jgi:rare lipoprotein A